MSESAPPDHDSTDVFAHTSMTLGEHLEELRIRLFKALGGLAVGIIVGLVFGNKIFGWLAQPLLLAFALTDTPPELYVSTLPEAFLTYLRVGLYTGLFISSPWILYQLWGFVAAGLYPNEKRVVQHIAPFSMILFVLGGLFLIWVVAPISCLFFVRFAGRIDTPHLQDNFFTRAIARSVLGEDAEQRLQDAIAADRALREAEQAAPDPCAPTEPGLEEAPPRRSLVRPLFTLQKYVSFILILALAFGVAFQMPLVVFFLGRLGIVTHRGFAYARRYVLFGLAIISAIMTPTRRHQPDSHVRAHVRPVRVGHPQCSASGPAGPPR